jgi:phosphoglucosamine mutase
LINVRAKWQPGSDDLPAIRSAVKDAEKSLGSGGRVLLRPSGTEPVVRVMVEGVDEFQVKRLAKDIADAVQTALG